MGRGEGKEETYRQTDRRAGERVVRKGGGEKKEEC